MVDDVPRSPATLTSAARRLRFFAGPIDDPRARRAGDIISLVVSTFVLAALGTVSEPPSRIENAFIRLAGSVPDFLDTAWRVAIGAVAVMAFAAFAAVLAGRRWTLLRDIVLAALLATVLVLAGGRIVEGQWPDLWNALRDTADPWVFPGAQLALFGAVVIALAPSLARPLRRPAMWTFWVAVVSSVLLGTATPSKAAAGALVAVASAAAVHVVFGSSRGRPGIDDVAVALTELGVPIQSLWIPDRQPAGVFVLDGEDTEGRPLVVKVYGRDAHDAQLLARAWRTLWYRGSHVSLPMGRIAQVEHEALLTLLAGQAGIGVADVVTAGASGDSDALLVLRSAGESVASRSERWTVELIDQTWQVVGRLHQAGIAHGELDSAAIVLLDDPEPHGPVGLAGMAASVVGSANGRRRDRAQLFVATLLEAGEAAAIASARAAIGDDGLAAVLPLLQAPIMTAGQRRRLRQDDVDLDDVRDRIADALAIDAPEVERLRRVSTGTMLQAAFLVLAFVALAGVIGGVDLAMVGEQLAEASWWLVVLGLVAAQIPRLFQAVSTLGACPVRLPLGPVYALQLAVSYLNLVIPGSAARIAVNIRFFQRQGLSRGASLAVGGVDGFGSLVVQIVVIASLLAFTSASLDLDVDLSFSDGPGRLLVVIVLIALAAAAVVSAIPRWRVAIVTQIRQLLSEAFSAVRGLGDPRRLGMLLGGNFAADVTLAVALGAFVGALGYSVGIGELVIIVISVSLLAGLLPIPGGIGVTEGGLIFGLTSVGVPDEVAFAAVVMYRLASFYIPPVWGFFAFRWLERNRYL